MPTYTFSCSCGWQADKRAGFDDFVVPCPSCQSPASRQSVYSINFGGFARTPPAERDLSPDYKRYTEASAELEYGHSRQEEAAGMTLAAPPLARMAMAKANDLISKGAQDGGDL